MRAKQHNIPLLLGSATPALETLNNALSGRYAHLQLTKRAGGAKSTHQRVLDARDQPIHYGISQGLLTIMRQHINAGNQVLVFVNRRGAMRQRCFAITAAKPSCVSVVTALILCIKRRTVYSVITAAACAQCHQTAKRAITMN